MHSVKRLYSLIFPLSMLLLSACAVKPPVQEMSDARSAVQTVHQLPAASNPVANRYLNRAESALQEAAQAMHRQQYLRARQKAVEAKRMAQRAAAAKQQGQK